jgi:hypothetical protein
MYLFAVEKSWRRTPFLQFWYQVLSIHELRDENKYRLKTLGSF